MWFFVLRVVLVWFGVFVSMYPCFALFACECVFVFVSLFVY